MRTIFFRLELALVAIAGVVSGLGAAAQSNAGFQQIERQAEAALDSNKLDDAIALYRKGLALRPSWVEGWQYLGAALYETGRYAEARDAFQRSTSLAPGNGATLAFLGLCEYELGEYDKALAHIQEGENVTKGACPAGLVCGLGGDPKFESFARARAAFLLIRAAAFEAAMDQLLPLAKRGDRSADVVTAYGLGALRMAVLPGQAPAEKRPLINLAGEAAWALSASRPDDAARLYKQLVTAYPREPGVHYAYAVHLLEPDPLGALAEFQKELEISPRHVYARLQIAFLELKRGDPAAALERAKEAVAMEPGNFLGHNAIGRALLALDKIDEAVPELEQAVKLAPEVPQTHFFLEQGYRRAGRNEEARREHAEFSRLLLLENPLISPLATPPPVGRK